MTTSAKDDDTPRRAWVAALASSLVPGSGQLYVGERRRGALMLTIDLILGLSLIVLFAWFRLDLLKLWVTPDALVGLLVINIFLLAYRFLAVATAYSSVPSKQLGLMGTVGVSLAALLLVAPHLAFGYVTFVQYDLIDSVFPDPVPPVAAPTTTTSDGSSTSMEPGSGSTVTTIANTTTTTSAPAIWDGLERLNIVLLGADAGAGRTGLRTDTTIVLSIDPETGNIAMFSVPRDLSNAPLPPGMGVWDCQCWPDLITHLYDGGVRNPEAFPGPGDPPINAIKGALGEIFGIPIHYYALVTLDGFVGIVDALGGVTIDVPKTIVDETYPHEDGSVENVVIEAGTQHLDGHLALAYARIRRHADDFARMHRQRCVLAAVLDQTTPLEILANFGGLATAIKENVSTDIPQDRLVDFVDLLPKLSTEKVATLRITRAAYKVGTSPGRVYYDIPRIRTDAQELISDPAAAQQRLGLLDLEETCDKSFD